MKTLTTLLLTAVLCLSACIPARADTTNVITPTGPFGSLGSDVDQLFSASNYSANIYGTYAPSAPDNRKWGGGALVIYNVNNYVGLGLGADFLGQLSLVSANATLQLPIAPFASLTNLPAGIRGLQIVPFGLAGIAAPLSGSSSTGPASITDLGGAIKFGHLWGGRFDAGASWGRWSNAGIYSGERYHLFLGYTLGI